MMMSMTMLMTMASKHMRIGRGLAVLMAILAVSCGGTGQPEPMADDADAMDASPPPVVDPGTSAGPRVFFVSPQDGATVSAAEPLAFEFGVEEYEIEAVPEEVEQVRAGVGHFHLGVDTDCLPAGEEIPKADPWIHFGDASSTIEMQVEPGEHQFALQVGDDEHRVVEGLCTTISVTVEEGGA